MDFLKLVNGLAAKARPVTADDLKPLTSLDQKIMENGMDSLDAIMVSIYLCELYGIPEEVGKTMPLDITAQDLHAWLEERKSKDVTDADAALESVS